jgi:hypothetical protein
MASRLTAKGTFSTLLTPVRAHRFGVSMKKNKQRSNLKSVEVSFVAPDAQEVSVGGNIQRLGPGEGADEQERRRHLAHNVETCAGYVRIQVLGGWILVLQTLCR